MSTKSSTRIVEISTVASGSPRHTPRGAVALVMNAGTDNGCRIARDLVRSGYRVAVSGRQAMQLTRVVAGLSASRVRAIAADPADKGQVTKLVSRVENGFGRPIALVIHAEDDAACEVTK